MPSSREYVNVKLKSLVLPAAYFCARMPPAELAVIVCLASHANFTEGASLGLAWPGLGRIAVLTSMSTSAVQRAIKALVTNKFLEIKEPGGGRKSNIYLLPHVVEMVQEKNAKQTGSTANKSTAALVSVPTQKQPETVSVENKEHNVSEIIEKLVLNAKRSNTCRSEAGLRRSLQQRYERFGAVYKGKLLTAQGSVGEALDVSDGVKAVGRNLGILRPRGC